jgi:hypothetical protein
LRGVSAWRSNTGAARFGDRFVRFGVPGVADILGVLPPSGRLLAVEVKGPGGRVRPSQRAFLDNVEAAGGLALVVRDVAELERALVEAGAAAVAGSTRKGAMA